jgi:hypothetical protein
MTANFNKYLPGLAVLVITVGLTVYLLNLIVSNNSAGSVVTPISDRTPDALPKYANIPPTSALPLTVYAEKGAAVIIDRTGDHRLFKASAVVFEGDYLEASPGASLNFALTGGQVSLGESTGVAMTRIREDDLVFGLASGEIGFQGSISTRLTIHAGSLLIQKLENRGADFTIQRYNKEVTVGVSDGDLFIAYVDLSNETQVVTLKKGDVATYKNGQLNVN